MREYDLKMKSVSLNAAKVKSYDCVLIATDHSAFDWNFIAKHARLIVDTRNATRDVTQTLATIRKS